MSIKDTYKHLKELVAHITADLEKSENGNKAASQRVRTGTVKLEKVAKLFRKESIAHEKKTKGQKKPAKAASAKKHSSKSIKHAPAKAKSPAKKAAAKPKAAAKGHAKAKVAHHAKPRHLAIKHGKSAKRKAR